VLRRRREGNEKKIERKREDTKLILASVLTDTVAKKEEIEGEEEKARKKENGYKVDIVSVMQLIQVRRWRRE
jgi:hypothetical protein